MHLRDPLSDWDSVKPHGVPVTARCVFRLRALRKVPRQGEKMGRGEVEEKVSERRKEGK